MRFHRIQNYAVVLALGTSWIALIGQTLASSQFITPKLGGDQAQSILERDNEATSELLGGPNRYQTFITTDKPIYRTGDIVYVRGVVLNAANHRPVSPEINANPSIEIKGPKGDVLADGWATTQDSVWSFAWTVPQETAGGEYNIRVTYPNGGLTPASRKFDVRVYREPRLKSQIKFQHDGYGPGEKVQATLDVKRAEGGFPVGAKVSVIATVDGAEIKGADGKVDQKGLCTVSFNLPSKIKRGEGTLALVIEDGGVVETAPKTIPILLQTVDMQIYPEGGDLIADYKNRVYIQANQPNGKPADLEGTIVSKTGSHTEVVGNFRTEHEGRGRFEFIPKAHKHYFLTVSKPVGIKTTYDLPEAKSNGAVLHVDKDVFKKDEPITIQVQCIDANYQVTLSKREVEVGSYSSSSVSAKGKPTTVTFNIPSDVDGVLTATVWSKDGIPLAERLIFREPSKTINVKVTSTLNSYAPGNPAKLTIKATDTNGKPVSAVVGLTVTDDTLLEMVDKREQAPRLPVMVYLEPEVKDLADAQVYLDPKNSKAPLATDLLLGTQGWRRFALMNLYQFIESNRDAALNVVALRAPGSGPQALSFSHIQNRRRPSFNDVLPGQTIKFNPLLRRTNAGNNAKPTGGSLNVPGVLQFSLGGALTPPRPPFSLPKDIGRVEGSRDLNLFQVEPTVIDERRYTAGRSERHQKTSPTLPEGSPIPDVEYFGKAPSLNNVVAVREYAHEVNPNRQPHDRIDFTDTLYWNAGLRTDPKSGEATIRFGLNDSVTTFKVFADAFANNGGVGSGSAVLKSFQPFYAETKLPLEVTAGDKVLLPITVVNSTSNKFENPKLLLDLKGNFIIHTLPGSAGIVNPSERKRWIVPIDIGFNNGRQTLVLTATSGSYADNLTRTFSVKPSGFPVSEGFGGIIEPGKSIVQSIIIPAGVVPASMVSNANLYATPLASMNEALQRMIQDPNGCFEQTSSTSYPLTMAQQYFLTHTGVDSKLVETAREKLDAGYKRLVSFWCPDRGYEWFGQNPGHEALTAYGLLHFADMSKVRDVDQNMVSMTRAWLLKQKDGKGGFNRNRRALESWTEDRDCSNAYIVWALLETGQPPSDLKIELESLKAAATASQNSYVVALAANAFYLAGDKATAKSFMDRLVAKQKSDGQLAGVTNSIVGSGGISLEVEGTSLATLAWLRDPAYAANVERSIKFLADCCKDGRYGSTQATVLALRAVVEYDKERARPSAPGKVEILVDNQTVGDWVNFDKSTQGAIKLPNLAELLTTGTHKVELRMEGGKPMPYSLAVNYNVKRPVSSNDCQLDINVKLAKENLIEGVATEAFVTVVNKSKDAVPNPVAIIGLPGGLEPRHDQLKELVKKNTIDAYEVRGREIVLYWRALGAGETKQVPLSVVAAIPGSYTGPASRAYLYYTDESKKWVPGVHCDIAAKQNYKSIN
jgi:alpha-2-macroglobulin-like protein